jgi:hypothetical protein
MKNLGFQELMEPMASQGWADQVEPLKKIPSFIACILMVKAQMRSL